MPLLLCFENDFLAAWTDDKDLTVSYLCDIEDWVFWFLIIRRQEGAACGGSAVPFVGFCSSLLGELICGLKVSNGIRGGRGGIGSFVCFKSPEVEDETGP